MIEAKTWNGTEKQRKQSKREREDLGEKEGGTGHEKDTRKNNTVEDREGGQYGIETVVQALKK